VINIHFFSEVSAFQLEEWKRLARREPEERKLEMRDAPPPKHTAMMNGRVKFTMEFYLQ
jgi:hypothetical protein